MPALLIGVALLGCFSHAQTITQDLQSRTNIPGTTACFTVTATCAGTLAYQLQFNGTNLTHGGSILGATTTNLTISNVQSNHTGFYAAAVTDSSGSVTSRPAFLLVFLPPVGGTVDATFTPSGSLSWINAPMRAILPQPDGKVLVGGEFTYVAGVTYPHLMRLEESGAVDPSFAPTLNGLVGLPPPL